MFYGASTSPSATLLDGLLVWENAWLRRSLWAKGGATTPRPIAAWLPRRSLFGESVPSFWYASEMSLNSSRSELPL